MSAFLTFQIRFTGESCIDKAIQCTGLNSMAVRSYSGQPPPCGKQNYKNILSRTGTFIWLRFTI